MIKDLNISISACELYDEKVFDLSVKEKIPMKTVTLKKQTLIKDSREFELKTRDDFTDAVNLFIQNRRVGDTKANDRSSRSHAIYTIKTEHMFETRKGEKVMKKSELCIVDLAGSERQKNT